MGSSGEFCAEVLENQDLGQGSSWSSFILKSRGQQMPNVIHCLFLKSLIGPWLRPFIYYCFWLLWAAAELSSWSRDPMDHKA